MLLNERDAPSRDGSHDVMMLGRPARQATDLQLHGGLFVERGLQRQLRVSGWRMVGMVCLAVASAIVTFLLTNG